MHEISRVIVPDRENRVFINTFLCCVVQKDVAVEVNGEMAAILQSSRFSSDFRIQMSDNPEPRPESTSEVPDDLSLNNF